MYRARFTCSFLIATICSVLLCAGPAVAQTSVIVSQVHTAVNAGDFETARKQLGLYQDALGVTPEYIEALSWIGRGEVTRNHPGAAEENSILVRKLCDAQLKTRKLDAEGHLPIALGAAIEVEANVLNHQGQRDQAVVFLRDELKRWRGTSIVMRLQKNLNLLTLEGKPVPVLDVGEGIGDRKPLPLSAHKGHPVLLFLWAHWCPDCKAEVTIVSKLQAAYGPRGLVVVAPTQRYGYVKGGETATPAEETKYIAEVFSKFYAELGKVEVPLSEENFKRFGVSTTPTMVLVDGAGIVRMYNPGAATYEALSARIESLLAPAKERVQQ
jgi:thiol-disulfide isomerase/thioredoxin